MTEQTSTIPRGWKMTTLGEVISSGLVFNHNNKRYPLSGGERLKKQGIYPYYGAASAIDFIDEYKYDGYYLLVAEDGTVYDGKSPMLQLVNGKFWVSNHSHVLQGKDEVITRFLSYILKNVSVSPYITGAVQPKLTKENLYSISFLIPESNKEQRAIAAVLSSLDDKIELLREQNKTLEATAQAIFKEWFVNFNFPGTTGKMIDSELGKIPEGWRVGKLGDKVKIVYGKNLPTESLTKSGYTVFGANGQIGFYDKFIYEKPQVLVSCRGEASGKVNISLPESFVTNNSLVLEIADDSDLNFCFLKFFSLNNDYTNFVTGSAQPQITIDSLKNCDLLLPKKEVTDLFNVTVERMDKKQLSNFHQIQTLSTLRDTLLPKLMKGEVRVEGFKNSL